jgi:hypothetical protein
VSKKGRKEEEEREVGSSAVSSPPAKAAAGPCVAPCPIQWSRFPNIELPSSRFRLLIKLSEAP